MKKNWSKTSVVNEKNFFNLYLDEKILKSVEKKKFNFINEKVVNLLKQEIDNQGHEINFSNLLYYNIFSLAVDKIKNHKTKYVNEVCKYAFTDLICYRANKPLELVELQNKLWNPVLIKLEDENLKFKKVSGIMPIQQSMQSIKAIKRKVGKLSYIEISCLLELTKVTGSVLLAYSMKCKYFDKNYIYNCSFLDDIWQSKKWGMIEEINENLRKKKQIINKISNVFDVLK